MGESDEDIATSIASSTWGVILQEKYVNARCIQGCPTMDLIGVLTVDHQLIVYVSDSSSRCIFIWRHLIVFYGHSERFHGKRHSISILQKYHSPLKQWHGVQTA